MRTGMMLFSDASALVVVALLAVLVAGPEATAERIYWNDELASALLESKVVGRHGERLGEIRDVLVDFEEERASFALVESGGFLGLFEQVRAFPLSWFAPGKRGRTVVLGIDHAELERAGQRPPYGLRASALLGREVHDRNGAAAGELRDLVVNLGDGRLRHAVLVLADPERQVTVRPGLLVARPGERVVVALDLPELQALVKR